MVYSDWSGDDCQRLVGPSRRSVLWAWVQRAMVLGSAKAPVVLWEPQVLHRSVEALVAIREHGGSTVCMGA